MFDGLLKSKFYSKCKKAIKITKTRIEMIKRKRNAMQKHLRNDISDLLRNALDINAYGRAEGLLVELNVSAGYDLVEQFCGCVSNHLSLMNKQRECPEECQEAVTSLMFAAARFADLPELRELRTTFANRYGNSLQANVNHEFVEKLKAMPPTKDMKLQLLQDIALDSGLQWDSKALEQKLYNPPPSDQASLKDTNDEKFNLDKTREEPVKKIDNHVTENKQHNVRDSAPKRNKEDLPSHGRKDQEKISNSERKVAEEKAEEKKPFYNRFIPPPYTKPKASETETNSGGPAADGEGSHHSQPDSVGEEAKPKPRSVRRRPLKPPPGHDNIGSNEVHKSTKQDLKKIANEGGRDQKDEDERAIDRLLMHYSAKKSPYELDKAKSADIIGNATKTRTKSLPSDPMSPTEKSTKGHARAASYQPDTGHVHPNLPDYDDFVARLAAFREK